MILLIAQFFLLLSAPCLSFTQVRSSSSISPRTSTPSTSQLQADQSSNESWAEGGSVSVSISKRLSSKSPSEAAEAWLEHHWKRGGGLPILVTQTENGTELKRVIYPVAMEESITLPASISSDQESFAFDYHVSKPGPFFADLVPGSHQGKVTMSRADFTMVWKVKFETTRFRRLYQLFTECTIGVASRTVEEALRPSILLTLMATIPHGGGDVDGLIHVRRELLEFFWARGGGLPLLPPIPYGEILPDGGGTARTKLLRVPPLLTESIVSTHYSSSDQRAEIVYKLEQPGWTTFPFLLHTHLGRIQLSTCNGNDDDVNMLWQVEIRPWPIVGPIIKSLVEMTISTITRNFITHMSEPGSTVELRPPKGENEFAGGFVSSFGTVQKASWLGGVVDAHLKDTRSSLDQTISLLQPWAWGRSGDGGERDEMVTFAWSDEASIDLHQPEERVE